MEDATPTDADILSLQFLMNKTRYVEYLKKMNPEEYTAKKNHDLKFDKFYNKISHLVNYYLENHKDIAKCEKEGCVDLNELFNQFINRAIEHFQSIEDNNEEADNLFDIDTPTNTDQNYSNNDTPQHTTFLYELDNTSKKNQTHTTLDFDMLLANKRVKNWKSNHI